MTRDINGNALVAGVNRDRIDISAGLAMLESLGWSRTAEPNTHMLIGYCLNRWRRGEEAQAEAQAIALHETDSSLRTAAIDLTSWYMVLAASRATAEGAEVNFREQEASSRGW